MRHHILLTWSWPPRGLPSLSITPDLPTRTVVYNQKGGVVLETDMRPGDDVYQAIMRHRLVQQGQFELQVTGVWFNNPVEGYVVEVFDPGVEPAPPRQVWYGWEQFYGEG